MPENGKVRFILHRMRKINYRNPLLSVLFIAACNLSGQVYYKSGTFSVLKAQKLVVFPGVMGSPVTTTVNFELVLKKCTRLQLDSFWMDGYADKVNLSYANGQSWDGKPLKGDTIRVSLVYYMLTTQEGRPSDIPEIQGSVQQDPPVSHKGKAIFRYSLGEEKKYYFSIREIENLESIYAP